MFDMLNAADEGDGEDNEYDNVMAASFIDVSSFFHQENIWKSNVHNPELASTTAATTRGGGDTTPRQFYATGAGGIDNGNATMTTQRYEIVKFTEDVMESGIDPKEWQ